MIQCHTVQKGGIKNLEDDHPRKKLKTSGGLIKSPNISTEEALEDDLFKDYLTYNSEYKLVKKQGSLLESLDCIG